tara:strand:+ start:27680 stop:28687 length:1008 start_codon:yes stop_codon:yes gene_type:complete
MGLDKQKNWRPQHRLEAKAEARRVFEEWRKQATPDEIQTRLARDALLEINGGKPASGRYQNSRGDHVRVIVDWNGEATMKELSPPPVAGKVWLPEVETFLHRVPVGEVRLAAELPFSDNGDTFVYVPVKRRDVGMVELGVVSLSDGRIVPAVQTAIPWIGWNDQGLLAYGSLCGREQVGYRPTEPVFLQIDGDWVEYVAGPIPAFMIMTRVDDDLVPLTDVLPAALLHHPQPPVQQPTPPLSDGSAHTSPGRIRADSAHGSQASTSQEVEEPAPPQLEDWEIWAAQAMMDSMAASMPTGGPSVGAPFVSAPFVGAPFRGDPFMGAPFSDAPFNGQ